MGELSSASREAGSPVRDHGQHLHSAGDDARRGDTAALVNEADASSPLGVPHEATPCILVMGCGAAVSAAGVVAMDEPPHVVSRVETDVALAPDSPALGLEPPPPRA
jgi:hypothetical protein